MTLKLGSKQALFVYLREFEEFKKEGHFCNIFFVFLFLWYLLFCLLLCERKSACRMMMKHVPCVCVVW